MFISNKMSIFGAPGVRWV